MLPALDVSVLAANLPGVTGASTFVFRDGPEPADGRAAADATAVLGAVREDIRQTLRTAWIDPALEAAAVNPVFFTAAWSAIRPNVGKSFILLARVLRNQAVEAIVPVVDPDQLRPNLTRRLNDEELKRVEDSARAVHLAAAKAQIVVHALSRAVRRERIPGTGREEPPIRRGVPDWQRWMSLQPAPDGAPATLEEATHLLSLAGPPTALRLFARWPAALETVWPPLKRAGRSKAWREGALRLRRTVLSGIVSLPHPVELQWTALRARGFTDDDRRRLADALAAHDAAMAAQTLMAAFLWAGVGSPDVGVEG